MKDLVQALELAAEMVVNLPATGLSRELYNDLVAMDGEELNHFALIKVLVSDWLV